MTMARSSMRLKPQGGPGTIKTYKVGLGPLWARNF